MVLLSPLVWTSGVCSYMEGMRCPYNINRSRPTTARTNSQARILQIRRTKVMEHIKTVVQGIDVGAGLHEGYKVFLDMDNLEQLNDAKVHVLEALGGVEESLASMSAEEKKSFCRYICDCYDSLWTEESSKEGFTTAIMEGNLNEANRKVDDLFKTQQEAIFKRARAGAMADIAASGLVIYQNMDFVFKGCRVLEMQDRVKTDEFRAGMARLERRHQACMASPIVDTTALSDIVADTHVLKSAVSAIVSERENARNQSLVNGFLYLAKGATNLFRLIYLRDTSGMADTFLYGGTTVLCGVASGTSFFVAHKYHGLMNHMGIAFTEVEQLLRAFN